jgi:anti-sigma B factor antagonist
MVTLEKREGIDIVSFDVDRIDALNVDSIRPVIAKLFDVPYTNIIIDLEGVRYLDSTAFAMFLHLLRVARSNYCIYKLCGLSQKVRDLFELLQLDKALDIFTDRYACLDSYRRNGPL